MHNVPKSDGSEPLREPPSLVRFAGLVLNVDARTLDARIRRGNPAHARRVRAAACVRHPARTGRQPRRAVGRPANRRFEPFDRSVDALIVRLRRKIEPDPKEPRLIVTVPGEGYRFDGLTKTRLSDQRPSIPVPVPQDDERRPEPDPGSPASPEEPNERELPAAEAKPVPSPPANQARPLASGPRLGSATLAAAIAALVLFLSAGAWIILGDRLTNTRRSRPSLDRRPALRQSLRRSAPGLFRRRHHR